jgi:tetratricopeptide (TPR) repeat protein
MSNPPCRIAFPSALQSLLLWALAAAMLAMPASALAQTRKSVPHDGYFSGFGYYYDGDFKDSWQWFREAARSGFASTEGRWIDSICFHTMLGESLYQQGDLAGALEQYTSAIKLFLAYRDWMLTAEFPPNIEPEPNVLKTQITWGKSTRVAKLGHFPPRFNCRTGQIDIGQQLQKGGVVVPAQLYPVYVSEIVRCTTVSILRRAEILGPACQYDPLTGQVLDACLRRPAPPNHWSQCWAELQLGAAYLAANRPAEAASEFTKSLLAGGQYDHPLTSLALLELGKLAFRQAKYDAAITFFLEATYAAAYFERYDVMEEAFRHAALAHVVKGGKGDVTALAAAAAWARQKRVRILQASLWTSLAEIHLTNGDLQGATAAVGQARSAMNRSGMLASQFGARFNFESAKVQFASGNLAGGNAALAAAMAFQKGGSRRLYQISLADRLFTSGAPGITERTADLLYAETLREPAPADWIVEPMETLAVVSNPHPLPYEHWLEVALSRKEFDKAVNIADRLRRHRFFASLLLGGRILALRWVLEAPPEAVSEQAVLQRQALLVKYPRYAELSRQAAEVRGQLDKLPLLATEDKEQVRLLAELGRLSTQQEAILQQIALRREPSDFVFPPLLETAEIQRRLPAGRLVVAYIATSTSVHAFAIGRENYAWFKLAAPAKVKTDVVDLLRQMGHFDGNQAVRSEDLESDAWKAPASRLLAQLINNTKPEEWEKIKELVVVPDGVLWYLPFEALQIPTAEGSKAVGSAVSVRYAPTVSLAVPDRRGKRPLAKTAIVAGKLWPKDEPELTLAVAEELGKPVGGSAVVPAVLPAPSALLSATFHRLVVLSDLDEGDRGAYSNAPMLVDKGKPGSTLADWFALPWASPEQVVLPGFHTAAENALKRGGDGDELFLTICGLMSTGTRSILISRWRTAGRTSLELVREFVQELPHSTPSQAWKRSVELAKASAIDPEAEPRVRLSGAAKEIKANHPFFWSGYLLVDSEPEGEAEIMPRKDEAGKAGKDDAPKPTEPKPKADEDSR